MATPLSAEQLASLKNRTFVVDTEVYVNYFLAAARDIESGEIITFERGDDLKLDRKGLHALLKYNKIVTFNGISFDMPIMLYAIKGASNKNLKRMCDILIGGQSPYWEVCRSVGVDVPRSIDHIDLIEVAPGFAGLKLYGGRMGAKKLQDLPYPHDAVLTDAQIQGLRDYCDNDLILTQMLYEELGKPLALRETMSEQYGVDLRSKSDAQIAETVIVSELTKITGRRYYREAPDYNKFKYTDPGILTFQTPTMQKVFARILETDFEIAPSGSVMIPEWLKEPVTLGGKEYKMGIGGLHSMESSQHVEACDDTELAEYDVASYYPAIIMQQGLYPHATGADFRGVYGTIVKRRLKAKHDGDKSASDTLKIAINGTFGKLGSKYSVFYAPRLLIQTTVTGQLALLMLIERMHLIGVEIVSANTDGVVMKYAKSMAHEAEDVAFEWMLDTTYILEKTPYKSISSRDVNNYVAVTDGGYVIGKGAYSGVSLRKNPAYPIVYKAAIAHIARGEDMADVIYGCKDINDFVTVRTVNGGAKWQTDEPIGRVVRFYKSNTVPSDVGIQYVKNGNNVPMSLGARPIQDLPNEFPSDIDYDFYIAEANKVLRGTGYPQEFTLEAQLL